MGVQGKGPTDRATPRQGSRGETARRDRSWRENERQRQRQEKSRDRKRLSRGSGIETVRETEGMRNRDSQTPRHSKIDGRGREMDRGGTRRWRER